MKEFLRKIIRYPATPIIAMMERSILLQGAQASLAVRTVEGVQSLSDIGFRVFSEYDEDGIIEWLVARLPAIPRSLVEFGVEDYSEANTRFLLRHRNWRGLVMDGSPENIERTKAAPRYWQDDLTAIAAFINRDNINGLIANNGFGGEIGILSIDLDGNDYWIWRAIDVVNPWIVIVEYNAVFGDISPLTIPYDPDFQRTQAHFSNLYWGAGIRALEHLADKRGYKLLGSNLAGNNAFFLRTDLLGNFEGRIVDRRCRPSLYRESRAANGSLSHLRGRARRDVIANMPVVDVIRDKTMALCDAGNIYSQYWAEVMGIK